jgi:hypothetical protein
MAPLQSGCRGEFERTAATRGEQVGGGTRPTCWGRLPSEPQQVVVPQELGEARSRKLSTGSGRATWWIDHAPKPQVGLDEPRSGVGGKAGSQVGLGFAVCQPASDSHVVNPQDIPSVTAKSECRDGGRSLRSRTAVGPTSLPAWCRLTHNPETGCQRQLSTPPPRAGTAQRPGDPQGPQQPRRCEARGARGLPRGARAVVAVLQDHAW